MKRFIITLVALSIFTFLLTWFAFPQAMSRLLLSLSNISAGVKAKTVNTSIGDIHYLEGGLQRRDADTIVLVHGIYARKEHWLDLIRELTPYFHVVSLDLPGFGENRLLASQQYQLQSQAINLDIVLRALDISKAHFATNSMGAQVTAMLVNKQPELIQTLAFIGSPLGVPTSKKSDMDMALTKGKIPLAIQTEIDFEERNNWLFLETPSIPIPIMKTWMQEELSRAEKNVEIWHAVHKFSNTPYLLDIAPTLDMPSLIIWCQEDRIFHVSGASLLHAVLPASYLEILKQCGHLPMLDKKKEVSDAYLAFLTQHKSNG